MKSRRKAQARGRWRSLGSSSGFETFVVDQLAELGEVTPRRMFGGVGLYCGTRFFGLIARDDLYFKADDLTRGDFEAAGSTPFKPYPDRPMTMQYYRVPLAVLESAPELVRWARRATEVAERAARVASPRRAAQPLRPRLTRAE